MSRRQVYELEDEGPTHERLDTFEGHGEGLMTISAVPTRPAATRQINRQRYRRRQSGLSKLFRRAAIAVDNSVGWDKLPRGLHAHGQRRAATVVEEARRAVGQAQDRGRVPGARIVQQSR